MAGHNRCHGAVAASLEIRVIFGLRPGLVRDGHKDPAHSAGVLSAVNHWDFPWVCRHFSQRGEARPRERLLADSGWRFHLELPMSTTSYS